MGRHLPLLCFRLAELHQSITEIGSLGGFLVPVIGSRNNKLRWECRLSQSRYPKKRTEENTVITAFRRNRCPEAAWRGAVAD